MDAVQTGKEWAREVGNDRSCPRGVRSSSSQSYLVSAFEPGAARTPARLGSVVYDGRAFVAAIVVGNERKSSRCRLTCASSFSRPETLAFDSITSAVCPRPTLFEGHGRGSRYGGKNAGGFELPPLFSVSRYVRFGPDGGARYIVSALGNNTTGRVLACKNFRVCHGELGRGIGWENHGPWRRRVLVSSYGVPASTFDVWFLAWWCSHLPVSSSAGCCRLS